MEDENRSKLKSIILVSQRRWEARKKTFRVATPTIACKVEKTSLLRFIY